jgi:hypothetical protein
MPKSPTSFKPGQSGNTKGRPKKGETMTDILKSKIDKNTMADNLIKIAFHGEDDKVRFSASKYIYDRIDGMPKQTTQLQGDSENPLTGIVIEKASDEADSQDK